MACFLSRSTFALTPSIAPRAFSTLAEQCPQLMPSIVITFLIPSSPFFSLSLSLTFSLTAGHAASHCPGARASSKEGRNLLSRSALLTTLTELKLMAAAAIIGLSWMPKAGYRMPAAMGMPTTL